MTQSPLRSTFIQLLPITNKISQQIYVMILSAPPLINKKFPKMLPQTLLLSCLLFLLLFFHLSSSAIDTFIYGGCSSGRFTPGSPYESNVNSVLTSLVNSASFSSFNNFKISVPGSTQSDIVYGLFQCRGDLSTSDCKDCVAHAVSRIGVICPGSSGGAMQLDGCFVKYDSASFLGVEDKTEVFKKCGPSTGYSSDILTRRDAVLAYMTNGNGQYFRVGGSGSVQGVAQCVQDLSLSECEDCLSEASGQLKSDCGASVWGDMYLGKCYVRYSERGFHSRSGKRLVHQLHHRSWWFVVVLFLRAI